MRQYTNLFPIAFQVEFVTRAISMLSGFLDAVLYFALEGRRIGVIGSKESAGDIVR